METRLFATVALLFAFGALLMALIHRVQRTPPQRAKADWVKYTVFAGIVIGLLIAGLVSRWALGGLLGLIAVLGSRELAEQVRSNRFQSLAVGTAAATIIVFCLAHLLVLDAVFWWP